MGYKYPAMHKKGRRLKSDGVTQSIDTVVLLTIRKHVKHICIIFMIYTGKYALKF